MGEKSDTVLSDIFNSIAHLEQDSLNKALITLNAIYNIEGWVFLTRSFLSTCVEGKNLDSGLIFDIRRCIFEYIDNMNLVKDSISMVFIPIIIKNNKNNQNVFFAFNFDTNVIYTDERIHSPSYDILKYLLPRYFGKKDFIDWETIAYKERSDENLQTYLQSILSSKSRTNAYPIKKTTTAQKNATATQPRQHNIDENNSITIDGYKFSVLKVKCDKRPIMEISSNSTRDDEKANLFTVYRSISGMFWRFALFNNFRGMYEKGDDYVLDTMLDFRLQMFLENKYLEFANRTDYTSDLQEAFTFDKYYEMAKENDDDEPFYLLEHVIGDRSAKNLLKIVNRKQKIKTKASELGRCGFEITKEQIVLGANLLSTYYDIVPDSHNCIYKIERKNDAYTLRGIVKSVVLTSKGEIEELPGRITLFYLHLDHLTIGLEGDNVYRDSCVPILMRDDDGDGKSITKYGLVSACIYLGAYICKILEYTQQCKSTDKKLQCTDTYTYIGHLWDTDEGRVFPFNNIDKINRTNKQLKQHVVSKPPFNWNKFDAKYCSNLYDFYGTPWNENDPDTDNDDDTDSDDEQYLKDRHSRGIIIYTTETQKYYCYDDENFMYYVHSVGENKPKGSTHYVFASGTKLRIATSYTLSARQVYDLRKRRRYKNTKVFGIEPESSNQIIKKFELLPEQKLYKLVTLTCERDYNEWVQRMETRKKNNTL